MDYKSSRGRQKIEMRLIEDKASRLISFSKRRLGLYKKACELSVLCGAQIAMILYSISGKPYTYTSNLTIHNFVHKLINNRSPQPQTPIIDEFDQVKKTRRQFKFDDLTRQFNDVNKHLECGIKKQVMINKRVKKSLKEKQVIKGWWKKSLDGLSLYELETHKNYIDEFDVELRQHINNIQAGRSPSRGFDHGH